VEKYRIAISDRAKIHLQEWKMSGQVSIIRKIEKIFRELAETPYSGTGRPEKLKYGFREFWSRRIDRKNRIIYQVDENIVTVFVLTARGHND
jgi:toxin YoeB